MLNLHVVQLQLLEVGFHGFTATHCDLANGTVRAFLIRRATQLRHRPDRPMSRTVQAAAPRLATLPSDDLIYRWEAHSSLGRIVGYSTDDQFLGVYPWIMQGREWVGSVIIS